LLPSKPPLSLEELIDLGEQLQTAKLTALSRDELAELGAAMVSDERQLTTHAHPSLPAGGPFGKVGRWAASVIDKRRDKSADIGWASS
jgi:hypothetical protein